MVELGLKGDAAVAQALRTLLLTEKGSVPFRPNFGLGADRLLGLPANDLSIAAAVAEQVENYEPRVVLKQVQTLATSAVGHIKIRMRYTLVSTGEEQALIETI